MNISWVRACFATKNAASAEVAARAAFETSVNIRFMLSGDRNSRVVAWIRNYVREDEKQINEWEKALGHLSDGERQVCVRRIATGRKVHGLKRAWLGAAEAEFAQWPVMIGIRKLVKMLLDRANKRVRDLHGNSLLSL